MKSRIVLLGPPASGKGTQAELITRRFHLPVTSPGAMLREEKRLGTELGIEAAKLTSQGQLVPDALVVGLVERWLAQHDGGFIFDGFPRSVGQADALGEMLARRGTPLQVALSLETSIETLQARVSRRLICTACGHIVGAGLQVPDLYEPCPACGGQLGRRSDDTPEVLVRRLEEYREKSEPLLAYYAERHLLARIDSSGSPNTVFSAINAILEAE